MLAGPVFDAARHTLDYDFVVQHPDYRKPITHIDSGGYGWLNFKMTDKEKLGLFLRGTKCAEEFLAEFDWVKYKLNREESARTYAAALP